MRHHIFLFQIISFKKHFYVSLGNNFFTVFVEASLVVEALGNCPVCPPLNPALTVVVAWFLYLSASPLSVCVRAKHTGKLCTNG